MQKNGVVLLFFIFLGAFQTTAFECSFSPVNQTKLLSATRVNRTTFYWNLPDRNNCIVQEFTILKSQLVIADLEKGSKSPSFYFIQRNESIIRFDISAVGSLNDGLFDIQSKFKDNKSLAINEVRGYFKLVLKKDGPLLNDDILGIDTEEKTISLTVMIGVILGIPMIVAAISVYSFNYRKKKKLEENQKQHEIVMRAKRNMAVLEGNVLSGEASTNL